MKKLIAIFFLLGTSSIVCAQSTQKSGETIGQLSRSAAQELAKSTLELTKLEEEIQAERLPMAQKLTALEEKMTQLRRKQEEVSRQADVSNLDSTNAKAETKARQDELNYIAGLLEEYARTFDSKINISEMQYCKSAVETVKAAMDDKTKSQSEKFVAQLDFVRFSKARLINAIGGMRFPGVGVDQQGIVVDGQFAIIGPIALFSNSNGSVAGLALPQSNSTNPLIRPLEGPMQTSLASLVSSGEGLLPLDPSRGAALKAFVQKTSLIHIFEKGGPIMWPLLVASILSLAVVLDRTSFLLWQRLCRNTKSMDEFFKAVSSGNMEKATLIGAKSRYFVVRAMGYAIRHKEQSLASALLYAQALELKKFRRGIPILDTVITLAPLLGLLGTVTGMMGSFSIIGGDLSSPGAITGGIAEALIATAFGLGIAITSVIPFNILNTKLEEARLEMEAAATQLELLVHPGAHPAKEKAVANPSQKLEAFVGQSMPGAVALVAGVTNHVEPHKAKE